MNTSSPYAGVIFLLVADPTDRALNGWHLGPDWFAEELVELGIAYDSLTAAAEHTGRP